MQVSLFGLNDKCLHKIHKYERQENIIMGKYTKINCKHQLKVY